MNLLSLLAGLTKSDPHATALIDVDPDQPAYLSRAELWRRTLQLRADLATSGVGRGDAVVVWLPNWSDVLDWHIATASLGAHAVGLDPRCDADDVARVLERAQPRVVALAYRAGPAGIRATDATALLRDALARTQARTPAVAVVTGPRGIPPIDPSPCDVGGGAWLPSAATAGMPMPVTGGDELAVAFTPSLAAHRESAVVRHARATARAIGIRADDALVCARPLSDPLGLSAALAAVAGGATCLLAPAYSTQNGNGKGADTGADLTALFTAMTRLGATHLAAGDDLVLRFADTARGTPRSPSSWRWLGVTDVTGRTREAAAWAEREFGVVATGVYGSADVLAPAGSWPSSTGTADRWEPGGWPVSPDIEVRAVDVTSREPVPAGEQGELQFRGYNVVDAYLGDPGADAGRLTEDGWFATGDLGVLTADGGFRALGRVPAAMCD